MNTPDSLDADNETTLVRLKKALSGQTGFQLVLLEAPEGATREQVVTRVLAWSGQDGVPTLRRLRARGRAEIVPRLTSREGGIVLEDIDSASLDDATVDRLMGAMNWQRDQLRRRIAGPLILVMSARGVAKLFERAPDLVSWRSHTSRFKDRLNRGIDAREPDSLDLERVETLLRDAAAHAMPVPALARLWLRVGRARSRSHDSSGARAALAEAERLAESTGDWPTQGEALVTLVGLDLRDGDLAAAEQRLERLDSRPNQTARLRVFAHLHRSALAKRHDDWARATAHAREAVELARRDGVAELLASALLDLANVLGERGELDAAAEVLHEARDHAVDTFQRVQVITVAALIERSRNRPDRAITLLEEAISVVGVEESFQDLRVLATIELADVLQASGSHAAALRALRSVQGVLDRVPDRIRIAALRLLGQIASDAKQFGEASRAFEGAARLTRTQGDATRADELHQLAQAARHPKGLSIVEQHAAQATPPGRAARKRTARAKPKRDPGRRAKAT